MSELLLNGYWLEASANGFEFLLQSSPFSNPIFDPSFSWPALENNEPFRFYVPRHLSVNGVFPMHMFGSAANCRRKKPSTVNCR